MKFYPNAKINLGLHILNKRPDGFHEIDTLMYPISLVDEIEILVNNKAPVGEVTFENDGLIIDGASNDNLVYRAYKLLHNSFDLPAVKINLKKNIPFGAGLGGGSADAAFTIKSLNEMFQLNISVAGMQKLSAQLGSDCPFFIENVPAFSRGRGEILTPFKFNLSKYKIVLVIPPVFVSTKIAYANVLPAQPTVNLETVITEVSIPDWPKMLQNDFEASVFQTFPQIKLVKERLYEMGAVYVSMSGSGSSVFGLFDKTKLFNIQFPENYFVWQG